MDIAGPETVDSSPQVGVELVADFRPGFSWVVVRDMDDFPHVVTAPVHIQHLVLQNEGVVVQSVVGKKRTGQLHQFRGDLESAGGGHLALDACLAGRGRDGTAWSVV